MAEHDAGSVSFDVLPNINARSFSSEIKEKLTPVLDTQGRQLGKTFSDAIRKGFKSDSLEQAVRTASSLATARAQELGSQAGARYGNSFRAEVTKRLKSMPVAKVQAELDDAHFNASLDQAKAKIDDLSGKRASVQVDVDSTAADAKLAETQAQIDRVDGRRANVNVGANTGSAMSELKKLGIVLAALTAPQVIPVAVSGLGALAAGGSAIGIGLGATALASIPGIKAVTQALSDQNSAQKAVGSSASTAGSSIAKQAVATDQARIKALQMASAQDQLKQAEAAAAQAHQAAVRQVQSAEQGLTSAQQQARQAQLNLNQARKDAAAQIAAYKNELVDARLAERSDALAIQEAQAELDQVRSNPQSTQLEIARAQLSLDMARQSYKEQVQQTKDLAKQKADADKKGVNGSAQVVAAQQQVQQANQQVQTAERELSDARAHVAQVDQQSAEQVRAAQRAIQEQMLQNKLATDQAKASALSAAGATDHWGQSLAKLTGPERDLYDAITRFKTRHDEWAKSLENPVFHAYSTWLDTISSHFGLLSPSVTGTSKAIDQLGKDADKSLSGSWWKNFFRLVGAQTQTDTYHLGRSVGNIGTGLAGVVKAFLPYAPGFFKWLDKITGRFANWGKNLGGSKGFNQFISDSKKNLPTIRDIFKDLWQITKNLGSALGDASPAALKGIENILSLIGKMSPSQLQALLVVAGGAYVGGKIPIGGSKGGGKGGGFNLGAILSGIGLVPTGVSQTYNAGKGKKGSSYWTGIGSAIGGGAAIGSVFGPLGTAIGGAGGAAAGNVGFLSSYLPRLFTDPKTQKGFNDNWFNNPFGIRDKLANGIRSAWDNAWGGITSVPKTAWNNLTGWFSTTFVVGVKSKFTTVKNDIRNGWNNGWSYVSSRPRAIWNGLTGWWSKTFLPGVKSKFTTAKNDIHNGWNTAWSYVSSRPRVIWNSVSGWFTKSFLPGVRSKFTTAKNNVESGWKTGWNYVSSRPRAIWNSLSNWFGKTFVPGLRNAFSKAVGTIRTQWNKVESVAKKPISFMISTVYDRGIRGTWDKVADWLHLGSKWHAPYIKPLANGGIRRFADGGENHTAEIAKAGEMRLWAEPETGGEAYIPMAQAKRARSTQILGKVADEFGYGLAPKGLTAFADGGLWNWVKGTFSKVASKVTDFGKGALNFLGNPVGWLKNRAKDLTSGYMNQIPGLNTPYGAAGKAVSSKILDNVVTFAEKVASLFGNGGSAMKALQLAETRLGVPYVYGGTDWANGMDCSGLTMLSYRKAGVGIPRTSQAQWGAVKHISLRSAQPGDLVFTEFNGGGPGHVGFRTQYPYNSPRATFNEPHTGAVASYRPISGWTAAGVVPGSHSGGVVGSTKGGYHAGPNQAKAWVRSELPELGWRGQFSAVDYVYNHESGWRWNAANPSGAYGIPQALPGSKMRSAGSDWHDNAYTQLKWGLGYFRDRYGSPNNARSFWQRHHYYAKGGEPPVGSWGVTGENGPEYQYFGSPTRIFSNADSERLTQAARGGDGAAQPLIGTVNQQLPPGVTPEEMIQALTFDLTKARMGGVHS